MNERPDDFPGTLETTGEPITSSRPGPIPPNLPGISGNTSERYELRGEIARGGMGAVFAARDRTLNRDVAVKVLREDLHGHTGSLRRFVEEAQITGQIQHPGLPPVHDFGNLPDGRPFIAMKLIKGRTLSELLGDRPNPAHDLPRFLMIVEQICQAVAYAHSKGVIHRDLKPGNVMVGAFGEVQVMDWGLAKVLGNESKRTIQSQETAAAAELHTIIESGRSGGSDSDTRAGSLLGTPAYMPPEQARGEVEHTDRRSDVFALGAILCEVLTGRPAYVGTLREMQAMAVMGHQADALERLARCSADAELIALTSRCLAPRPDDRPADAGAVAEAVAAYRAGVEGRLRKAEVDAAATAVRVAEERKRRRFQVLTAFAVLLAAGGVGWLWERQAAVRREEKLRQEAEVQQEHSRQEALTRQSVEAALAQADDGLRRERFEVADAALAQAERRLTEGGAEDLRDRLARTQRDLGMVRELDRILERRWTMLEGKYDVKYAREQYPVAFRGYGIAAGESPPSAFTEVIQTSAIRKRLIDGLDEWYAVDAVPAVAELLAVADTDPARSAIRTALQKKERFDWQPLVRRLETDSLPPGFIASVCGSGKLPPDETIRLLRSAQAHYPDRFTLPFLLANKLWSQGEDHRQEAIGFFRVALAVRTQSVAAYINLAIALNEVGEHESSLVCCRRAVELDPQFTFAHNNLGVALSNVGKVDEALACYRKAVELDPTNATAHRNAGLILRQKGDVEGAVACFRKAIEVAPAFVPAHNSLGVVLKEKGDLEGAMACYRKAVELEPKNPVVYRNLGVGLWSTKDFNASADALRKAIELDPKHAPTYDNLGIALDGKGDVEGAIAAFRKAVEIDPKNAPAYRRLGMALWQQKDAEGSAAALSKSVELDPKDAGALDDLGVALSGKGDLDGAIACYRKAIGLDPKIGLAHRNLAIALGKKGDRDSAIASWRKALEVDAKDAAALSGLGTALWEKKDFENSVACLRKAAELTPGQPSAYLRLGIVLRDKGDRAAAIESFRKATEVDPKFALAYSNLGDALFGAARFDDSRDVYRKWLTLSRRSDPTRPLIEQRIRDGELLTTIQTRLPDLLAARAAPANPAEALALCHFCEAGKRYAARVHFAEFALAAGVATPSIERYNAACAACRAAVGEGADPPAEADRPGMRRKALGWLREELVARRKLLEANPNKERVMIALQLKRWQTEADFASVRDAEDQTSLSADEQTEWKALWREVEEARSTAGSGPRTVPGGT